MDEEWPTHGNLEISRQTPKYTKNWSHKKNPDPGALVRIWFHTNSSSQISYSQLTVKIFADTRPSGKLYHIHDFARRVFDCIFDSLQARF